MQQAILRVYEKVFVVIFLFILVYFSYIGVTTRPSPGDNWDYHIPIAKSVLNGSFIHPVNFLDKWYYPGSSEAILSVFQFLGLSLNLFNFLGLVIFFLLLRKLGVIYGLNNKLATIYSVAVCSLPAISFRLLSSQSIDLWLVIYIVWIVILLKNPKKSIYYFASLGILFGMLIGTKYTGPLYSAALLGIFFNSFKKYFSFSRFIVFIFFIASLGLFWYIRNYIYTGNPFFPEAGFLFPHSKHTISSVLSYQTWKTLFMVQNGAVMLFNAMLSDIKMWIFAIPAVPLLMLYVRKNTRLIKEVLCLSLFGSFVFLISPSWFKYDPIVSSLRYAYPMFTFLILAVFIYFEYLRKTEYLILLALANILVFPPIPFHAKLILILLPLVIFYEWSTNNKVIKNTSLYKRFTGYFKHNER